MESGLFKVISLVYSSIGVFLGRSFFFFSLRVFSFLVVVKGVF